MNNESYKNLLTKTLTSYGQTHFYFSYEEIKALLEQEKINITPSSLKSYIFELTKRGVIFDAGKGWYSSIKEPFELNTKPVKPIIRKIKKEFPLLDFSCWSTEQLNSFTHHLMAKFITFVYVDSDYMRNLTELLKNKGYNVYENPNKAEIEKQFTITDKTVVIRPSISKQPKAVDNCSPIEKILIDFLIENKKLSIMDYPEAENTVKNALNAGKINISEFFAYAKRREFDISKSINQVQNNINPEIVD
jgi:hypothetical protein